MNCLHLALKVVPKQYFFDLDEIIVECQDYCIDCGALIGNRYELKYKRVE